MVLFRIFKMISDEIIICINLCATIIAGLHDEIKSPMLITIITMNILTKTRGSPCAVINEQSARKYVAETAT